MRHRPGAFGDVDLFLMRFERRFLDEAGFLEVFGRVFKRCERRRLIGPEPHVKLGDAVRGRHADRVDAGDRRHAIVDERIDDRSQFGFGLGGLERDKRLSNDDGPVIERRRRRFLKRRNEVRQAEALAAAAASAN